MNTYHLYSTKWDIDDLNSFIIEYYIDSHYSLLFESRVFKGLNIYWPSTVVIFLSLLASELIFVASSDHSFFHSNNNKVSKGWYWSHRPKTLQHQLTGHTHTCINLCALHFWGDSQTPPFPGRLLDHNIFFL